ncbi:MAG TPA: TonB-dependent receptor [Chondromyces sp.]|nr:TonB-dependent receptor [Chondromyces sp.]
MTCVLMAAPLLAQNPTGTITGRVTHQDAPMPGVTVTASSPAMQGDKVAITGEGGEYIFRFLPPGDYIISFALDGFRTLEIPVVVSVAQTKTIDAEMYSETVEEEIVVTGNYETVSSGSQSNFTITQDLIDELPVARNLQSSVLLTPGAYSTGPSGNVTIAGAQSYENLFLVNGVVVNENLRGQPFDLYIEDAVEETTTTTSGVSAEYGRFSGGVVNMITKSGGNQFSGSFRASLTNESWNGETPLTTSQEDKTNTIYEATFGGYIVKDALWFFLAGRDRSLEQANQFFDLTPYTYGDEETRYEGKLTWSPHSSHRFIGSYMEVDRIQTNYTFGIPMEPSQIDEMRDLPQDLLALNYTGVLTESFFVEAQYSQRHFTFADSGGIGKDDPINGTEIIVSGYGRAGAATFCGECDDEERNMENWLAKASWFLGGSTGTHDVVFGIDSYNDMRLSNNYQTPSNFRIYIYDGPAYLNGTFYPVFGEYAEVDYWPIFNLSAGTEYKTNSAYVNDTWRLSPRWTISAGLRYDKNDGVDGSGATVADDSRFSPRLGASWDINGDGNWVVNASVARYVTAIANSVASLGGAGVPSWLGYEYGGPQINTDGVNICGPDHPELCQYTTPEAMEVVFGWFDSVGGVGNTDLWYSQPAIRGVNQIVENLKSPYADEYSIGVSKRLGNKGVLRADYVRREYHDFYATQRDLTTGQVFWEDEIAAGVFVDADFDLGVVVNEDNLLKREYDGLHTAIQYRFNNRLQAGGTYSLSRSYGNFDGETSGSGPITSGILNYPEYVPVNYATDGDLAIDQRHKLRAWVVWDVISTSRFNLSASWLENFSSGSPYGSNATVLAGGGYDWWFTDPGYLTPPLWTSTWVEPRDTYRTDDIHRSDLSLNFSFFVGRNIELFIQPEVLNVFNEDGIVGVNTKIDTRSYGCASSVCQYWNPFDPTYTPVEGLDWEKGPSFGQPENDGDYQTPRTFRVSLGLRF